MSADAVDDLHAAEDSLGELADALRSLVDATPSRRINSYAPLRQAIELARAVLSGFEDYCRPTCGWRINGECESGGPDECGCLCGHGEAEQ